MIDDQIINFAGIDDLADIANQILFKGIFDGVHQGNFIIQNQIGVVGRAFVGGIAVEISDIPIHCSDPIYVFLYFHRKHQQLL